VTELQPLFFTNIMAEQLTAGICSRIHFTEDANDEVWASQPVVQFVSAKQVGANGATNRWRAIVSDGQHVMQAMLATQLNHFVEDQTLKNRNIICIEKFTCNNLQAKRCGG
jgi:replication factor A1